MTRRGDTALVYRSCRRIPDGSVRVRGATRTPTRAVRDGAPLLNKNGRPRRFRTFGSVTRAIQAWPDVDHDSLFARVAECAGTPA